MGVIDEKRYFPELRAKTVKQKTNFCHLIFVKMAITKQTARKTTGGRTVHNQHQHALSQNQVQAQQPIQTSQPQPDIERFKHNLNMAFKKQHNPDLERMKQDIVEQSKQYIQHTIEQLHTYNPNEYVLVKKRYNQNIEHMKVTEEERMFLIQFDFQEPNEDMYRDFDTQRARHVDRLKTRRACLSVTIQSKQDELKQYQDTNAARICLTCSKDFKLLQHCATVVDNNIAKMQDTIDDLKNELAQVELEIEEQSWNDADHVHLVNGIKQYGTNWQAVAAVVGKDADMCKERTFQLRHIWSETFKLFL